MKAQQRTDNTIALDEGDRLMTIHDSMNYKLKRCKNWQPCLKFKHVWRNQIDTSKSKLRMCWNYVYVPLTGDVNVGFSIF